MYSNVDISQVFKDFVEFHPANDNVNLVPKCYVYLDLMSDLNAENYAKDICDKDKPFFYSQNWKDLLYDTKVSTDLPVLAVFEMSYSYNHVRSETDYYFQIYALDFYDKTKFDCSLRKPTEIYRDTEIMLNNLIQYLKECKYGIVSNVDRLAHKNKYQFDHKASELKLPETIQGRRIDEYATQNLYGSMIELNIKLKTGCTTQNFSFS